MYGGRRPDRRWSGCFWGNERAWDDGKLKPRGRTGGRRSSLINPLPVAFPLIGAETGGKRAEWVLGVMKEQLEREEFEGLVRIVRYKRT